MNPISTNSTSEDKTESVTNFLLISYLYLLAELENAGKESSGSRSILFRYIDPLLYLIQSVQIVTILALW